MINFNVPKAFSVNAIRNGRPGILAFISNVNIFTDETWDCRAYPDGDWSKAVSYAINNGNNSYWNARVANIDPDSHWIWTGNREDERVECRKVLAGETGNTICPAFRAVFRRILNRATFQRFFKKEHFQHFQLFLQFTFLILLIQQFLKFITNIL